MDPWIQSSITIFCAVLASSGFWAYLQKRGDKHNIQTQMLVGLGHDRIVYLGMQYIQRGYITQDEYENLVDYLYVPYAKLGGNGSAERVVTEVKKIPLVKTYICEEGCKRVPDK